MKKKIINFFNDLPIFRPFEPDIQEIKFKIGTTAEIYEYGEQNEDEFGSNVGFRVKAKVRQRFKFINARRQINGY